MAEKHGIAIAGTHGKTTTTAMVSLVLEEAGMDPTFVIGGECPDLGGRSRSGKGPHFVAEACEVCAAPVYEEVTKVHIAQKVAMYCRMARTCASMHRDEDAPDFSAAEEDASRLVADQIGMVEKASA